MRWIRLSLPPSHHDDDDGPVSVAGRVHLRYPMLACSMDRNLEPRDIQRILLHAERAWTPTDGDDNELTIVSDFRGARESTQHARALAQGNGNDASVDLVIVYCDNATFELSYIMNARARAALLRTAFPIEQSLPVLMHTLHALGDIQTVYDKDVCVCCPGLVDLSGSKRRLRRSIKQILPDGTLARFWSLCTLLLIVLLWTRIITAARNSSIDS